ncbi:MAG: hypothetical protein ACE5GW_12575 [Planctomycetota bacterium]
MGVDRRIPADDRRGSPAWIPPGSRARFPLAPLIWVALLGVAPIDSVASEDDRSTVVLDGLEFRLLHEERPAGLPPLPDLSRAGEQSIPGGVTFTVPVETIWGERIRPQGAYLLSIVVSADLEVLLALQPIAAGERQLLPLEHGTFAEPGERLAVHLLALCTGSSEKGFLRLRWGALLLEGSFTPLKRQTYEVGDWRLVTYEFPQGLHLGESLPLGNLEPAGGVGPALSVTLLAGAGGTAPRIRLESVDRRELMTEREAARRRLRRARRSLREAARGASGGAADLRELSLSASALEGRLRLIEQRLRALESAPRVEEIAGRPQGPKTTYRSRVTASLEREGSTTLISISGPLGAWSFPLAEEDSSRAEH